MTSRWFKQKKPTGIAALQKGVQGTVGANWNYVDEIPAAQTAVDLFKGTWTTSFPDDVAVSGGDIALFHDHRLLWLFGVYPDISDWHVLELGPLEGGHTFMLHQAGAKKITAIEAHQLAFLKCLVVKETYNLDRAHFLLGNFEKYLEGPGEKVDLILASGVLYHLTDPLATLITMIERSDRIFLWSHFFDAQAMPPGDPRHVGFTGEVREREIGAHRLTYHMRSYRGGDIDPKFCGGLAPGSVWLDFTEVKKLFETRGYVVTPVYEHLDHPNGPASALLAHKP